MLLVTILPSVAHILDTLEHISQFFICFFFSLDVFHDETARCLASICLNPRNTQSHSKLDHQGLRLVLFYPLRDSNGGTNAKMPNGFSVNANDQNNSPNSSQISGDGSVGLPGNHEPSLISRTQKQHITQQVILT